MKKIFNIFHALLVSVILFLGFFVSCDNEETLGGTPERLFRPIIKKATVGDTWAKFEWDRYQGAKTYEIELSIDSFKTALYKEDIDTIEYTFENLDYNTEYQIRIKSIGDNNITSEYYVSDNIKTLKYPTLLKEPTSADIIDNQVRVSWKDNAVYDRLDIYVGKEFIRAVELSNEDNVIKEKIIGALEPVTTYDIKAYFEDNYLGEATYKTVASQVFDEGSEVVDLRGLTEEESYKMLSQSFIEELSEGATLVLAGGAKYEISTVLFSKDINIVTGLSLQGYAILEITGNFGLPANTKVNSIKFEKIFFTDHLSKPKTSSNYGGTYAFNFNNPGVEVGKLVFNNCDIKYKRGFVRMQTQSTINTIELQDCLIDSISDYGVINNGNDNAYIGDIIVKNSTILHADKIFVCARKAGINSITVENITTYYSPKSGNYFFDYDTNVIPGGVVIKNSLFGPGSGGSTVHGIRSKATSITVDKSYRTSDLAWTVATGATEPTYPINDVENLGKDAKTIFRDPVNGDFTVSDESLVDKIGDQRWW
jgi:hypothetical protein